MTFEEELDWVSSCPFRMKHYFELYTGLVLALATEPNSHGNIPHNRAMAVVHHFEDVVGRGQ